MNDAAIEETSEESGLLHRAAGGDQDALRALFSRYRDRLKRMVHLRLNRRLAGRVSNELAAQVGIAAQRRKRARQALRDHETRPGVAARAATATA